MFNREYTLLLERYIAIPLVGYLIAHGLIAPEHADLYSHIIGETAGGAFVIIAYWLTHQRKVATTPDDTATKESIWVKLKAKFFVTTPPQQ